MFIFLFDFNFLCCERCFVRFPTKKRNTEIVKLRWCRIQLFSFLLFRRKPFWWFQAFDCVMSEEFFCSSCGKDICNLNGFRREVLALLGIVVAFLGIGSWGLKKSMCVGDLWSRRIFLIWDEVQTRLKSLINQMEPSGLLKSFIEACYANCDSLLIGMISISKNEIKFSAFLKATHETLNFKASNFPPCVLGMQYCVKGFQSSFHRSY